jgi:hypothetical protein
VSESTTFTLEGEPQALRAPNTTLLAAVHEARFTDATGASIRRFLTDKGRAEVLRRAGDGGTFTREEFERWTVEPDLEELERRYDAEAGEGA